MGTLVGLGGVMTPGGIAPQVAHVPGKDGGFRGARMLRLKSYVG